MPAAPDGMSGSGGSDAPRDYRASVGTERRSRAGAGLVMVLAATLIGLPIVYRLATGPTVSAPSVAPAVVPVTPSPSPSDLLPPTPAATSLSIADRALEEVSAAHILDEQAGPDRCDLEPIPMTRDRSVTLGGRVEARDHAGWVFTCGNEAGDRTRYFQLVSGVEVQLAGTGANFQGGLTYVGAPGGTLETRWIVSGDALSGEIEMVATPIDARTTTILVLLDLRGSWQGAAPSP